MKSKNIKITAGVLVILAAIAYLIISGFGTTQAAYAVTVSQALTDHNPNTYYRIDAKIDVKDATFNGNSNPVVLSFDMYDANNPSQKLHIIYNDVKPDNFSEATDAVVEGNFTENDTFHAKNLMLKCPSKYEAAQQQPAQDEGPVSKLLESIGLKSKQ